ncbi:MAG: hypothetical protein ACREDO_00200 [Methyloceanibacter sp.]
MKKCDRMQGPKGLPKAPPNDGSNRSSANPIELPLRTTTRPIGAETLVWELDKQDGRGVCRLTVLHEGRVTDTLEFDVGHLGELRALRPFFQQAWRANVIRGDWPLNFFGGMRPQ